ncbi:tail fiber protein [Enterobacter ludwigii]|uniref:phage tail protein n=2 Tax=Enterobacter cloacae complex TaxID=354276 RepID=UPI0030761E33
MANLPETPQWEDGIYQIEVSDPVLGGPDGISNRQGKQLASRTLYLKQQVEKGGSDLAKHVAAADPHTQYAPKASPTFTGTPTAPTQAKTDNSTKLATTAHVKSVVADYAPLSSPALTGKPTAPTAAQTANDTQLANTAFVKAAIAALVASSPEALDTLNELAAALGNDPNFATTMTNALAGKQPLDNTLTALSGKSVAALLEYLGLGEGSALPVGVPIPWPSATPPTGWLKCNGAAFTASQYPKLALAYPALRLPDLRGEFIRGWDDGRGVDAGRALMSSQAGSVLGRYIGGYTDATGYINGSGFDSEVTGSPTWSHISISGMISPILGQTVYNGTRPRNIAFNFIVRAA